ncbi:MAG TPA: 16S rRNA (guanine(966)-N(2))-methyltransferase RsmD [Dongiaceae bacterium]|jgi:16S rRNA (guanine966-N2)-methyltransferase|nr:16S rRNA (guanine(966)-N(2))-methyltransferase RsmD [Dongiaceae bacterium]
MRIIAGKARGTRLEVPAGMGTRPTGDRARQALFNILSHTYRDELEKAEVLDGFAGTGALGLEALSRGAARATFIESDSAACRILARNVAACRAEGLATILRTDVLKPPRAPLPASLVFLDPPYGEGLIAPALKSLRQMGWFSPGALLCLEHGPSEDIALPPEYEILDRRSWGRASVLFARLTPSE